MGGHGPLASGRLVVGRLRDHRLLARVVDSQHPARPDVLPPGVPARGHRRVPARLLRLPLHHADAGPPLRSHRLLQSEAAMAHEAFLRGQPQVSLLRGHLARHRRQRDLHGPRLQLCRALPRRRGPQSQRDAAARGRRESAGSALPLLRHGRHRRLAHRRLRARHRERPEGRRPREDHLRHQRPAV